jgi:RNA polymerase sigma-70 factor (ECF subfamily)
MSDLREELAEHRPDLLRHCYRMLGSFADAEDIVQDVLLNAWKARDTYAGDAPVGHWLMRIATNTCLNELARRRRRGLPQLDREPAAAPDRIEQLEPVDWLTPAPDRQLFAPPAHALELRESVALAFVALLQRLPPRQRAVLLLKDVVGWPAEEIAEALELSLGSVNSALHRARETISAPPRARAGDPPPEILREYVRSWEAHDLDALVALLRDDIVLAMPPHATWFRGAAAVAAFFRTPRFDAFWSRGVRLVATRANGQLALAYYLRTGDDFVRHSIQLVEFAGGRVAEAVQFVGADYLRGFDVPERLAATP